MPLTSHADLLAFARRRLGSHSARHVDRPDVRARLDLVLADGRRPSDAVLAEIKRGAAEDRGLEDELAAYLLPLALGRARARLAPERWLRHHLETADLAASVLGGLWPRLSELPFESEAQFCSLLARRMDQRLVDHARALRSGKRSEELREACRPEDLASPPCSPAPGPLEAVMARERSHSLQQALADLTPRQREVVELFVHEHLGRAEIARRLGITYEAARATLRRAGERLQHLLGDAAG